LIFLDAAYNRSSERSKNLRENNPWKNIQPPGLDIDYFTEEEYFAATRRAYPSFQPIWTEAMAQQSLHEITKTPEGKIVDKMSIEINKSIVNTLISYVPKDSKIKSPTLAFFAMGKGIYSLENDWMTEEQKAQIMNHFEKVETPWTRENIEQFKRNVPHAKVIEIPQGHHWCFIKHEEFVYEEMRKFLLG